MSALSDEILEHFTHYPQDANPAHLQALFQELKERRASSLLGDSATLDREGLWDTFSELVDDSSFGFAEVAGATIITKSQYNLLMNEIESRLRNAIGYLIYSREQGRQ
jgi:hypothetical protein